MLCHAYCVFCKRGQENKVIQILQKIVPACRVVRPTIKKKLKREMYLSNLMHSLCPQYLFLFSDEPIGVFVHDQYPVGIEYWLGDREHDYELLDADRDMAQALLACNGVFDD